MIYCWFGLLLLSCVMVCLLFIGRLVSAAGCFRCLGGCGCALFVVLSGSCFWVLRR